MKTLYFLLSISMATVVFAQKVELKQKFRTDFSKALDNNFSQKQLSEMLNDYWFCLYPGGDNIQLQDSVNKYKNSYFNLHDFKNEILYKDNINVLIESKNRVQRTLAYMIISSAYDTSKEDILLEKLSTENDTTAIVWAGISLMNIKSKHTSPLFDFLVKYEHLGDAHIFPYFVLLDKDSLRQTAYSRINSENKLSKILAAQTLGFTIPNLKTEELLKHAVETWDIDMKGYAISPISELRIGNLLELLKPLLSDKRTRYISLKALANSPTEADRLYLTESASKQDTVSEDLLNTLYDSKNIKNTKFWLMFLRTKPFPKNYFFSTYGNPIISSDSILPDLQLTLKTVKNKHILEQLVTALDNRTDSISITVMIKLFQHKSPSVRYWTAKTLKENSSVMLKTSKLKQLIDHGLKDGNTKDD